MSVSLVKSLVGVCLLFALSFIGLWMPEPFTLNQMAFLTALLVFGPLAGGLLLVFSKDMPLYLEVPSVLGAGISMFCGILYGMYHLDHINTPVKALFTLIMLMLWILILQIVMIEAHGDPVATSPVYREE